MNGQLVVVLHSHLPWVMGHGRWPHGSNWLMEAAVESYLPLLDVFQRLVRDGIRPGVTLGITPVLAEMLAHPEFPRELEWYCLERAKAADEDVTTFRRLGQDIMERLARGAAAQYRLGLERFRGAYGSDLLSAFRRMQDFGHIEIATSAATHGYLPLLGSDACIGAQVKIGAAAYRRRFGRAPSGFWMPECAYRPAGGGRRGIDEILRANDLSWTVVDGSLLAGGGRRRGSGMYAKPGASAQPFAPTTGRGAWRKTAHRVNAVDSGTHPREASGAPSTASQALAFYTRESEVSLQVWSGEHGYPGDGAYREFHKHAYPSGHAYWRVTDPKADLGAKELYDPDAVHSRIDAHAAHFVETVGRVLADHAASEGTPGVVAAPFDTELFGHWWHEGPAFLERVLRLCPAAGIGAATGTEHLAANPPEETMQLPEGSWGEGGGHAVWQNDKTAWTWELVHQEEARFLDLVAKAGASPSEAARPALEQAARELLLLEASDWQFLITTGSAADYAETRIRGHVDDHRRCVAMAENALAGKPASAEDAAWLEVVRARDRLFETIDLAAWR